MANVMFFITMQIQYGSALVLLAIDQVFLLC